MRLAFLAVAIALADASKDSRGPTLLAPLGSGAQSHTLDPHNNLPPPPPKGKLRPRLILSSSVRPKLKLLRRIPRVDGGAIGCTLGVDGSAVLHATARDPVLGGQVEWNGNSHIEWKKLWLFPGLTDAATRVEVRCSTDAGAEIKLGLMSRARPRGLSLVHRLALPIPGLPPNVRCAVDMGATLLVPPELAIGTQGGLRAFAAAAQLEADLDRLDVCVEL